MNETNTAEGAAPLAGHLVTPMVDGAAMFESVYRDLQQARWRIYIAMWAIEDDFVIHREPGRELRLGTFCKQALKEHPGLEIYLLVWDWEMMEMPVMAGLWAPGAIGVVPKLAPVPHKSAFCNAPEEARLHLALHANPPVMSHHQKLVLCDLTGDASPGAPPRAVAHCLGLNFQNYCWDLPLHPDPAPFPKQKTRWHDTGARVEGPAIATFEEEFARRWRDATGETLTPHQFANPPRGSTRALPLVHREQTASPSPVKEWYLRAIPAAREFIYLENQYFDDKDVPVALGQAYLAAEARGDRLRAALLMPWWEDLYATQWPPWHPIAAWTRYNIARVRVRTAESFKLRGSDEVLVRPPGGWAEVREPPDPDRMLQLVNPTSPGNASELAELPRHFAVRTGDRWVEWRDVEWVRGGVEIYRMMVDTGRWPPHQVYVHSKLGVFDDAYTVGSSNLSCQSFELDSEANLVVQGADEVREMLDRLWPPLLGLAAPVGAEPATWLDTFATVARQNQAQADLAARGKEARPPVGLLLPWQPYDY